MHRTPPVALLAILLGLAACQVPAPQVPSTPDPLALSTDRCFLSITRSADGSVVDTLRMHLSFKEGKVSGEYDWLPQEKDRMVGTLEGVLHHDTLTAVYTYEAEGMQSREQRLFLLKEKEAIVLSGEMVERDGIWTLKDPAHAVPGMTLPEVPCP